MSFLQKIKADWIGDGREIAGAFTQSTGTKASFDELTPADASSVEYAFAFDVSDLKMLFILAAEDLMIEFNDSASPTDTLNPKGNFPFIWVLGMHHGNPFTVNADVSKIFITHAISSPVRLQIEALYGSS